MAEQLLQERPGEPRDSDPLEAVLAAAFGPAPAPPIGDLGADKTLGDFRIIREIGRGGMGVVYEAEQISLGRRVALKVLPFAATLDPRQLQRFKMEAQAAAQLHHTNIVPVYGVGCERGTHFFAMQFIEGQSLAALIADLQGRSTGTPATGDGTDPGGRAPTRAAISTEHAANPAAFFRTVANLGVQAAEALEYAHTMGVVHRDVKPANLLLDELGKIWIGDFGLARLESVQGQTMTGDLLGTLRYMSPEQAESKPGLIDHRTDIYALGATLYELLTLQPVCAGGDRVEVLRQITSVEPRAPRAINPAIPRELETIALKALAKEPAARYATAQEMADDLERFLKDEPIKARRPSLAQRLTKWARRHRAVVTTAAILWLVACICLGIVSLLLWQQKEATLTALEEAQTNHRAALVQQKIAEDQQKIAIDQRRRARKAVDDMYIQVAEQWLKSKAQLLPVQKDFLLKALEFYQDFAREPGIEPEARRNVAEAYGRAAAIQRRFGEFAKAREAYSEAASRLEELAAEFDGDARYREELAQCLYSRALMAYDLLQRRDAQEDWQRAERFYQRLVDDAPEVPRLRNGLINTQYKLSMILAENGCLPEAEKVVRRTLGFYATLAAQAPAPAQSHRNNLAACHNQLGNLLRQMDRSDEAAREYEAALTIFEQLQKEIPNADKPREGIAVCKDNLGMLLSAAGRHSDAESAFREALLLRTKLAAEFANVHDHQMKLLQSHYILGLFLTERGRIQEAADQFRVMLKREPKSNLALCGMAWLRVSFPQHDKDPKETVAYAKTAVAGLPELPACWRVLGAAQYRAGDYAAAVAAFDKAVKSGAGSYEWYFLAMAHWKLGHSELARQYYDQAVAWMEAHRPHDDGLRRFRAEATALLKAK